MDTFGWHYPPGAEHDPRAPWNQVDDEPDEDQEGPDDPPDRVEGWDEW